VKSFQVRVTCWIAMALFALMFVSLVAFNIYAIHDVLHQAKKNLKTLSRTILADIAERIERGEEVDAACFQGIDSGLEKLYLAGPRAYAVLDHEGRLIHQTADFEPLIDSDVLDQESENLIVRRVTSTGGPGEILSQWHVLLVNRAHGFTVIVSDREDYESVERFITGFLVIVLLAAGLSIPSGYLLSRRILVPLSAIQTTIQEVRLGHLDARVPIPASSDEIAELASGLNQTFADLEALLDGMRRFCADAAHELKTPLTALRGNLEVCLGKERSPEEYQQVLGESVAEIASLSAMVHDLLLVSVSGDRERRANHQLVEPGPLFREAVLQLSVLSEERQVWVEEDIDDELRIRGDETLLPRICYNLLSNALRFAPDQSSVTVRWAEENGEAVLTVSDHGRGIAPDEQERIFERFYQVDESRSRGTGLGLAIVKWIVDLHDARIAVESDIGQGATFRVSFALPSA
jgi:signal transduction histidine kinase